MLQQRRQARAYLNCIRIRFDDCCDDASHILNVVQEGSLIEETMINSNIKTAPIISMQSVQPGYNAHSDTPIIQLSKSQECRGRSPFPGFGVSLKTSL